jgi:phage tail sheath protein FI
MAEKIISPGVFTQENDLSFVSQGISEIGGAIVGPTVKGPALVPTLVTSYPEYVQLFGDTFVSGSTSTEYLTSISAREYLKHSGALTVVRILGDAYSNASASVAGSGSSAAFTLNTIADGRIMNSAGVETTNNALLDGRKESLRYEVSNVSLTKGTFTLLVRRGDDTSKRKAILETWSGLSLDPNQPNFISKRIGDQYQTINGGATDGTYLQPTGNFPNKSKYLYVSGVYETPDYLDANGGTSSLKSVWLPAAGSGSFTGGLDGGHVAPANYFEKISSANVQGLDPAAPADGLNSYGYAIDLLSNADEYDVNMIWMPGLNATNHSTLTNKLITACETRGDCFAVIDPCLAELNITDATTVGGGLDTSYAAMYWPWVQTSANGKFVWVPPSTLIPGIYAFNDKVAAEWYAPAGLNRGGLETVVQAERKLTHANRDTLYEENINPLATFPGEGVVVWGQKTLQKKASALDRVNVRRLLINLKKFIASTSKYLVFENNTAATRNRFLGSVNPYMESVQQNQGLYAFKVVMDESNNTPDLIDRNIMKGEIYLQPAKAAEFIVVDFNIMPTGATFED